MAQTILEFRLDRDKHKAVQDVCKRLKIKDISIARVDYAQKLGALAGIEGFKKDGKKYEGPEFPAEMLVFSGMNSAQVDGFLEEYKKSGLAPIGLKAVITAQNIFWTAEELFGQIMREHIGITGKSM